MLIPNDSIAATVMTVILAVLIVLFIILILYTSLHRVKLNRDKKRYNIAEQEVQPLIYEYLDGKLSENEFSNSLVTAQHVVTAFRTLNLLIDNMRGEEREKLRQLLGIQKFHRYFASRLDSNQPTDVAQACRYFAQKNIANASILDKLKELQKHPYNVLNYSSTLALINSPNEKTRDEAFKTFLERSQNASMAVNDIVFKYCGKHENSNTAAAILGICIQNPRIPVNTAASLIRIIPELGYFQLRDILLESLNTGHPQDNQGVYRATLIEVLNELNDPGAKKYIMANELWKSPNTLVRLAVAKWALNQYEPGLEHILEILSQDSDLEVRIFAQKALCKSSDADKIVQAFSDELKNEWVEIKRSGAADVGLY
ncbi:MAG: HEAT repeat domain-containing protein [Balneolia bacterium]|nr:HEAT repeat domain-containing protein [Balneolia bacterium]